MTAKRIRCVIYSGDGRDISDEITLEHGRALPGGWSQREIHHEGHRIGWIESGYPMDFQPPYTFKCFDDETGEELPAGAL